jgi:transcriptional regulator with XRE-family HTH domain
MARGSPRLRTPDGKLNQIASRVRERRNSLRLTQDALCARLALNTDGAWNADRMEVYRIETGTRLVSDLEVLALAEALECSPVWLLLAQTERKEV